MNIPNYIDIPIVDPKTGLVADEWKVIFQQLITQLQLHASDEGIDVHGQTNANMIVIQNALDQQGNPVAPPGRLLFNIETSNGGGVGTPNGQLYVKLNDGTFHPITNT